MNCRTWSKINGNGKKSSAIFNIPKTNEFRTFCYSRKSIYFALLYIQVKFEPVFLKHPAYVDTPQYFQSRALFFLSIPLKPQKIVRISCTTSITPRLLAFHASCMDFAAMLMLDLVATVLIFHCHCRSHVPFI